MGNVVLLGLWLQSLQALTPVAPAPAVGAGLVRVCTLAAEAAPADRCVEFLAASLAKPPSAAPLRSSATGQLAFIDPESLTLVEPSRSQAEELSTLIRIDEQQAAARSLIEVETLPNGSMRIRLDEGFQVRLVARVGSTGATEAGAEEDLP